MSTPPAIILQSGTDLDANTDWRFLNDTTTGSLLINSNSSGESSNSQINRLAISSSGNIGIGTTSPTELLSVSGTVDANEYKINGSSIDLAAISGIVAGDASASKALVLDADKNIVGINSISTTDFSMNGSVSKILSTTWTQGTSLSNSINWFDVTWSRELGLFVSVGGSTTSLPRFAYSSDGINWSTVSITSGTWNAICWSPERYQFIAVGQSGVINRSSNGTTWFTETPTSNLNLTSICWAPELGIFVAVPTGSTFACQYTSGSGAWINGPTYSSNGYWTSVCWAASLGLFVAVAQSSSAGGYYVSYSSNATTWSVANASEAGSWSCVCWSPELSLLVAVSWGISTNRIMTSTNATTWTGRSVSGSPELRHVRWVPELSMFIATGSSIVLTSQDGITWTTRSTTVRGCTGSWSPELSIYTILDDDSVVTSRSFYSKHIANSNSINIVKNESITGIVNTSSIGLQAGIHLQYNGGLNGAHRWFSQLSNGTNNEIMRLDRNGLEIKSSTTHALRLRYGENVSDFDIDTLGNLNINTYGAKVRIDKTTGTYKLDVNGGICSTVTANAYGLTTTAGGMNIASYSNGSTAFTGTTNAYPFALISNGSNRLHITTSGNIGVGTTSPSYMLDVAGSIRSSGTVIANYISITTAGGNVASPQHYGNTQYSNSATFYGTWYSTNLWGIGAHTGSNDNRVRIGTCDTSGTWLATYCDVYCKSVTQLSDYRLKHNIRIIPYGLNEVNQLNPVMYDLKDNSGTNEIGFIAHDIQMHIPAVVYGNKDEIDENGNDVHQGVNYAQLTPVLVKAIQELSDKNNSLEAQIAMLIERVNALEK